MREIVAPTADTRRTPTRVTPGWGLRENDGMSPLTLDHRILNVFTDGDDPFSGNPVCVFTDARLLDGEQMQSLARQLNLSETTFVLPAGDASVTADVRIFTPNYEMPFAGHPTLGTAHVVRDLTGAGDALVLRMPAGDIPVVATDVGGSSRWTLTANAPTSSPAADVADLAGAIGVPPDAFAGAPLWVDTGSRQLVVPLRTAADVRSLRLDTARMLEHASRRDGEAMVYVWAPTGEGTIEARMLFSQQGSFREDPATGSACANLGGWLIVNGTTDGRWTVRQGGMIQRPSLLELELDGGTIRVGGAVREVGRGVFEI